MQAQGRAEGVPQPAASGGSHAGAKARGAAHAVAIPRESREQSPSAVSLPRVCGSPRLWLQSDKLPRSQTLGGRAKPPQRKGFPQLRQESTQVWEALGEKADEAPGASQLCGKTPQSEMAMTARENRPAFSATDRARSTPERLLRSSRLHLLDLFTAPDSFHSLSEGAPRALPSFGADLPAVLNGVDRSRVPPGRCSVSALSAAGFHNGAFLAGKGKSSGEGVCQVLTWIVDSLFFRPKTTLQKTTFLKVIFLLLPVALGELS